jgi:hypothetical protein
VFVVVVVSVPVVVDVVVFVDVVVVVDVAGVTQGPRLGSQKTLHSVRSLSTISVSQPRLSDLPEQAIIADVDPRGVVAKASFLDFTTLDILGVQKGGLCYNTSWIHISDYGLLWQI